jgi:hypothetical protein
MPDHRLCDVPATTLCVFTILTIYNFVRQKNFCHPLSSLCMPHHRLCDVPATTACVFTILII